jgi:hypothetical protein
MGGVYTDFANTNKVKSFGLLNSKIGYKHSFNKWDVDVFVIGNNLTNQINYTFCFMETVLMIRMQTISITLLFTPMSLPVPVKLTSLQDLM